MRLVFVMDPVSTVLEDADTTFALMLAAQKRGHRVDHCLVRDVYLDGGRTFARVRRATIERGAGRPIELADDAEDVALDAVDVVFIRKDPPFDDEYLWLTLLLEHLRGSRTLVVNDPRALRDANEHLYSLHFPDVIPESLVASDRDRIRAFVKEVGGRAVIKPVDGHGGEGIFVLADGDLNLNAMIETVTRSGRRIALVQRYLPEVRQGDKRILTLGREVLGAILRIPRADDSRSNIHVGGSVVAAAIDDADRRIIEAVTPRLEADGLLFVGLDVIGGYLTEVNVTSPTGIQQMERLSGEDLSGRVIERLESVRR